MDLTIYDIIIGPVISDRAYNLNKNLKKLVLRVHPQANKPMIAEAIEKLFNVKVKNVCVSIRKGKRRMVKRSVVHGQLQKKAIVTLADGYSVDMYDRTNEQAAPSSAA